MKQMIIFLFCLMTIPAFARNIDANTQLKINSNIVKDALSSADFSADGASVKISFSMLKNDGTNGIHGLFDGIRNGTEYTDVGSYYSVIYNQILEEILSKNTFSASEAAGICIKLLKKDNAKGKQGVIYGRNISHTNGCRNFALNLIDLTQKQSLRETQAKPIEACLSAFKTDKTIVKPFLCGGKCGFFGDDTIELIDTHHRVSYTVDDFCEGMKKNKEYWYFIKNENNITDVSNLSETQRRDMLKR